MFRIIRDPSNKICISWLLLTMLLSMHGSTMKLMKLMFARIVETFAAKI